MTRIQLTNLLLLVEQQHGPYKVFNHANLFLDQIPDNALPTSIAFNNVDEEIGMFWDNGIMFLDVGLNNNKKYHYSGFHRARMFESTGMVTHPLPSDIHKFLFKFANL